MSQHQDVATIVRNKLRDVLRTIDDETINAMRTRWFDIGPASTCPDVYDLMRTMHQTQATGLLKRNVAAKAAILEVFAPIKANLTKKDIAAVMVEVRSAFPENTTYVNVANGLPDIYRRQQAPAHRFRQQSYNTEAALMRVGSTNMARQAIMEIQNALDEVLMQQRIVEPSFRQRVRSVAGRILVRPITWLIGIVGTATAAFLSDWIKALWRSINLWPN